MKQVSKKFCIVAYDISDDKRRRRVIKTIEKYGTRINFSVFECMFTDLQLSKTQEKIRSIIEDSEDSVVFYPICINCFCKAIYIPERKFLSKIVTVIQ